MKTIRSLLVFVLLSLISTNCWAEKSLFDSIPFNLDSLSKRTLTQYAVPDLPAFNALGTEPINLLRPSTAKNISITANEFYDGKNIIIPKAFAVEFSPVSMIKGKKLQLADYQKCPALYNTRISIGTFRDSLKTSRVAFGIRTTLIDKGNPKSDESLKKLFNNLHDSVLLATYFVKYRMDEWAKKQDAINKEQAIKVRVTFMKEYQRLKANNKDSLNLIDKGNPKSDENLKKLFDNLHDSVLLATYFVKCRMDEWAKKQDTINREQAIKMRVTFMKEYQRLKANNKDSLNQIRHLIINDSVDFFTHKYKDNQLWNARRLDLACAVVGASSDSIAKNLLFDSFQAWITYACPMGDYGQFLLGGNAGCRMQSNKVFWNVSIPARVYIGSNDLKGLVEFQYQYKQQFSINSYVARLGCEYRLYDNIWLNFSAGVDKNMTNNTSCLVSDFKIVYGI
jgi:hypothetical protein